MSDTVQTENATSSETVVELTKPSDFVAWRASKGEKKAETPETKPEAESPKDDKEEAKAETPPKDEGKDVLSKAKSGNLDDLSSEELDQLAKLVGSKAVARFGELTAKRKAAEERAAALEAQLARREHEAQASAPEPVKDNPFTSIKDANELSAKTREIKEVIDFAEERLDDATDLGPTDVVATVDGKEYTKQQLRETLRKARKARDEYLPDVAARLAKKDRSAALRKTLDEQMRKELPWLSDDKDDRSVKLNAILNDPLLKGLEEAAPEVAAQLPFFMAHATNSMFGRRAITITEAAPAVKKPVKEEPPENAAATAASGRGTDQTKQEKELKARAASGRKEDWTALRALQISKRKLVR